MVVTISWPVETTRLKRMRRWLWSMAENSEPEWLRKAIPPGSRVAGW
jgi:hypothetical protein